MRYVVAATPGLAEVVAREARAQEIRTRVLGSDGRTDLLVATTGRGEPPPDLRTAEDVFVLVGEAIARRGLGDLLGRIWETHAVETALSVFATHVQPLRTRMAYRVVARLRSEELFTRTQLRDALSDHIGRARPRWRTGDPAPLEFWIAETQARHFVLGLRLTGGARSRRTERTVERAGALRPSVAAAMVLLAGKPAGVLLDPFCGAGTILAEARAAGWRPLGADIDPAAVAAAARNVGRARLLRTDAMRLPLRDRCAAAVGSNVPFGARFARPGDEGRVVAEMCRVSRPGAPVVLLAPHRFERALRDVEVLERFPIRLLGRPTVLWSARVPRSQPSRAGAARD